jgi:hypothetical protein
MVFERAPTSAARRWNHEVNALFSVSLGGTLVSKKIVADRWTSSTGHCSSLRGCRPEHSAPRYDGPRAGGDMSVGAWKSALAGTQLVRAMGWRVLVEVVEENGGRFWTLQPCSHRSK